MNRSRWLLPAAILTAVLQIGFLSWVIQGRAAILRDGTEVFLKVEPVDPRDLLRGDYVRLGYNISSVSLALFEPALREEDHARQMSVMIRVAAGEGGIWEVRGARLASAPAVQLGAGEVEIAAVMPYGFSQGSESARVDYGIERFYLPEGEGLEIERDMNTRNFFMKVAVGRSGTAQIKAFFDGDRQLYAEPLY